MMIDIERQVFYWRQGALEDWAVGRELTGSGHTRHGLFFCHLALEKLLKAHVCRLTQDLAPRIHNLVRLAETAGLPFTQTQIDILAEMNAFALEGRYPEPALVPMTADEAHRYVERAEEVFNWLMKRF
jgi:HEPN domain-containing protein